MCFEIPIHHTSRSHRELLSTADFALQVKLSDDYAQYDDADEGPLARGDIGTLVEDDGSSKPYKVQSAGGKCWWYKKEAIVKAEVSLSNIG